MAVLRITGGLRIVLAVCLWLLLSGLLLLLVLQAYELSRALGHLLIPANFEQEVASRARPMLFSNSVLLLSVVLWLGTVVVAMHRLLALSQNQTAGSLGLFCARWFGAGAVLLGLLWLTHRWLPVGL